jgi:type II secretory pathway pseudopilin PulG
LSLAEVMISLAISAMLLTAVAAAFSASSEAIEQNDEFFRASQAARVSMNQILTEVRRANPVDAVNSTATDLAMVGHDGNPRDYIFDAASKKLKLDTHTPTKPQYTLASNCSNANFTYDIVSGQVMRVSVTVIVQVGKNQIRLTGSAAPRKVQTWQ